MNLLCGVILALFAAPQESPLSPKDQQRTFTLSKGFDIELVASDPDIAKVVDIAFDDSGRMWAVTATEYPVDGNENPAAAELYRKGGRDRVLIFDTPWESGIQRPRAFAEGLAMPMAILPVAGGALIGHGPEILLLKDRDGDGRADSRETVLSGFGIQDSHLMPHRFLRGPGGWIYTAQGAFNSSLVKTKTGAAVRFDQCKVGRFRSDGSAFEIAAWGLNNIWGLVIDARGEMFIQEANDLGYSLVPFFLGASYPGIGMHRSSPYAPWQPPLADFRMGGTGLSGLALSDSSGLFPDPWNEVAFLANPIARKIQAVRIHLQGSGYRLEKLPDFLTGTDAWFRPIAVHFGPDGALYVVDWYNKIISHNEVPRNHPERDKSRGRIWRIRPSAAPRRPVPDLARAPETDLLRHLASPIAWESRAAWHQIVDRKSTALVPALQALSEGAESRLGVLALWCLEELGAARITESHLRHPDRWVRREAVRILGPDVPRLSGLTEDPDPQVRAEVIRALARLPDPGPDALLLLARMGKEPLDGPTLRTDQGGQDVRRGEAADREFERCLVREALERHAGAVAALLESDAARRLSRENRLLAALAIGDAARLARDVAGGLPRPPDPEELALLSQRPDDPAVRDAFVSALSDPASLRKVLSLQARLKAPEAVAEAARALYRKAPSGENADLLVRVASVFRAASLEGDLAALLERPGEPRERRVACLRALSELGSPRVELFYAVARAALPGEDLQREAALALAGTRQGAALSRLAELWPDLPPALRRQAVDRLAGSPSGGAALVEAVRSGLLPKESLDASALGKLRAGMGDTPALVELRRQLSALFGKGLRLPGGAEDYVDTDIDLEGPFTVEAWVRLDAGISNADGLLGAPGAADLNFHQGRFRVFVAGQGDVIVSRRAVEPEAWTHVAVTRGPRGEFRLYQNGALDTDQGKPFPGTLRGLDVGRSTSGGTAAWLAELRVWNVERTAEEIGESYGLSLEGLPRPPALAHYFPGSGPWSRLRGRARVEPTPDAPPLLSPAEAQALRAKFATFRPLASREGDPTKGREVFARACLTCHKVRGQGADIGPALDGAGLSGTEGLLRAILTPSAAVESGYRTLRIATTDGEILDGLQVSQDDSAVVLRQPGREDRRVPREALRRATLSRLSLMPEGLLEGMRPEDVSDLFSYLRTLR
jgi:putative membrane-bound dehydrogenase-like protein